MLVLGVLLAVGLYVLPLVFVTILRSRADHALWETALGIAGAVAVDLCLVLVLGRFVHLEYATLISRVVWLAAIMAYVGWFLRKGERPWCKPRKLDRRVAVQVLVLAALGLALSLVMTRPCALWDRQWHIPVVSSMRGQWVPFVNVFEPTKVLAYHYGADAVAAMLQTLSFSVLHATHAISLVHDISFAGFGALLGLLLAGMGTRSIGVSAGLLVASVFASPLTHFFGTWSTGRGYSLVNLYSLSFRPHVAFAMMLVLPFAGAILARIRDHESPAPISRALPSLLALTAALTVVDEFSVGLLGLGLGTVWLVTPQVIGAKRLHGVLVLAALTLALAFGILVFGGSMGPGTPNYPLRLVTPRNPGYYLPSMPLSNWVGVQRLIADGFSAFAVVALGALWTAKVRERRLGSLLAFFATITLVGVGFFVCLEYNNTGLENHRFLTAPLLLAPLVAWGFVDIGTGRLPLGPGSWIRTGFIFSIALGAMGGLDWLTSGTAKTECLAPMGFPESIRHYETNCRRDTGASLVSGPPTTVYGDPSIWYLYAGCQPVFAPGPDFDTGHDLKVGSARYGVPALLEIQADPAFTAHQQVVRFVCASPSLDPVCQQVITRPDCQAIAEHLVSCPLDAAARDSLARLLGPTR